jgi:hypothetical protein
MALTQALNDRNTHCLETCMLVQQLELEALLKALTAS